MVVGDTMKRAVISTSPQIAVLAAANLVVRSRTCTLPLVDGSGILIGIITIGLASHH